MLKSIMSVFNLLPAELMSQICNRISIVDRYNLETALGGGPKPRLVSQTELVQASQETQDFLEEEELFWEKVDRDFDEYDLTFVVYEPSYEDEHEDEYEDMY